MPDELFLRPTVIAGETAPGDHLVIWEGLTIGRIHRSTGVGGEAIWLWSCFLSNVPQPPSHRGRAGTLETAKVEFRRAWDDLKSSVSHAELAQARALQSD